MAPPLFSASDVATPWTMNGHRCRIFGRCYTKGHTWWLWWWSGDFYPCAMVDSCDMCYVTGAVAYATPRERIRNYKGKRVCFGQVAFNCVGFRFFLLVPLEGTWEGLVFACLGKGLYKWGIVCNSAFFNWCVRKNDNIAKINVVT